MNTTTDMQYKNLYQVSWKDRLTRTACFLAVSEERVEAEVVRLYGEDTKKERTIRLIAEGYSQIYKDFPHCLVLED